LADGRPVGEVTSGTHSPTLGHPIAMAYVAPECSQAGREVQLDIRGRMEPAKIVDLPFYQRKKK
ncbi:MAG: glycine cleavage T C-terminal barrel domain-containing protein, partial [Thermoguttaceae bacterium]